MGCTVWSMSVTDFIVSCNFSHKQVCFQQQLLTYSSVGFSERTVTCCAQLKVSSLHLGHCWCEVCVFRLVDNIIGIKTKMMCFLSLFLELGKSMWWKDRNSSHFHQGSPMQVLYPFASKHVIQFRYEQVQNNHDAINCRLATWSHCLKGNQCLSAGYMIRKLVIARHAWFQKVVSVEKLFQSSSHLHICIQSCLITCFILFHCCWLSKMWLTQAAVLTEERFQGYIFLLHIH